MTWCIQFDPRPCSAVNTSVTHEAVLVKNIESVRKSNGISLPIIWRNDKWPWNISITTAHRLLKTI